MTTTISNAVSSFLLLTKFTLRRETNEISGEEGTNSLETLVLILFTGVLSFFPTLFAVRRWIFPSLLQLGLKFVATKGVRVTVGSIGFLSATDVILNFSSPAEGGGDIEQISIGEIRYAGRLRHLVNWMLKTLYSPSPATGSTSSTTTSTTTTIKEGDVDVPEEGDGDASSSKEVVVQNRNRMMNVPIRCFDVQVKRRSARKTKKQEDYEDDLDGDYDEEEEEEEEKAKSTSNITTTTNNTNDNKTDRASKRLKESFKKRVVARFLSLLEINLVDLRVYDEDVFTVTTTQMVLTTKPVADALTVFVNMPNGIRIVPKSVRVGKKDNVAIAISKVSCSLRADLTKIGKVSDVQVELLGIDPVFTDDSQDLFNHAWIESVRTHQVRDDRRVKDDTNIKSTFALGYKIRNARSECFCFQNSLADALVQDQIDSNMLNARVKSSVFLTVPEISGVFRATNSDRRKGRSSRGTMDEAGGNKNTTASMKMLGVSLDFQDDCSLETYSRKVEIGKLEIEHHSSSTQTVQPATTKITMDDVQMDWDPDAHFLIETLSEDTKKFLGSLAFLKTKDQSKQEKEMKASRDRNISLDATNVSFAADLTLGANVRFASTRVHLEQISTINVENFEIETNAETFFTTKSLALEKRKHDSGWDITTSTAAVKFARDLDFGDFYAALFAGESAFKQALKKFTSTAASAADKSKIISKKASSNENGTVLNLPDSIGEVRWKSTGGNTFIIEDSDKLESFLRMQEKFLKPELKRSRKLLRDADETKDAQMIQQIFQNVAKAYKKCVDGFNENKKKDVHFLNLVDNILTVRAQTLDWSFKYGCDADEREKIGHFCRCTDAPYSDGVDLHITQYQTVDWTCEKFDMFLGGEDCAMFEAKTISMQGPVVLAKQSVQSKDTHLLPFPVGKRRFAAIRSAQSPSRPSVLAFTNLTQTWIDGKVRYLASSEPKYAILSREISNRMVPKSRHRDAPNDDSSPAKVKDNFPWWDNLRNLWRGDFTIIARNSQIVLDSSLKDTQTRHALAFKASKCEMSYKSGHILLRAARFAVSREPSFSDAVSHTLFVAPAVEIGVKYEWLTKDNINGYATSYRFDPTTGVELHTLSECKSCEGSHELSIQFACKDTLLPGWRVDHILDDIETKMSSSIAEDSADEEDFLTPKSSRKGTIDNFQTPLSSFQTTTMDANGDKASLSSSPLAKWHSDDFKTRISALKLSPSRTSSVLLSPARARNISDLHSVLNSFDGISMNSQFTETPYFRFTAEDMRYMKKWWRALMKPDLVSLRNAWRYKQYGKTKATEKSYGKTKKVKGKSMVSILYSKQPSWEVTAEYLNYSLPTKEKDETVQSIAAFLEGFSYISNASENLNVHAKDLRIFLPEKEENEATFEPNQMISANFDDTMREMLRGSNTLPSPRALRGGDGNGPIENKVTASSLREMVTDSMLVLESREFRVRKPSAKDEVRVDVDAPRVLLESKTREKVLTWIREMWQASLGDDPSIEKPPSMFELEKLSENLVDMDLDQYSKHRKNISATSRFSESSQSNAKTANTELDLLELIKPGVVNNGGENVVSEMKKSPPTQVIADECLFVVQISEPQINLRGNDRNGRLLLAADNGLVVGRRVVSSSSDSSSATQKQRLVDVNLHHVAAHVAPTDVDLRAGVQWLEDKGSDEEVTHLQPKKSSLLRQIFAPCEMIFKHSVQTSDSGESDDSDAPTKFSFKSPDIDATMESEQQAVLVDIIGSLFLTPSNFAPPSPEHNAVALLRKKGQRSLFDQEDAAASAIVAAPLLEYIKSIHALRLHDIDFQKLEDDRTEMTTGGAKENEDLKRRGYLDDVKRKEKALAKSIRRAESLTKYNRKRAAMQMELEIERGAWALRKAGKTFMNAEITNLSLSRERHVDSSGVTLFKLKGLHLQTVEKVVVGRWLLDEDWDNVPAAIRTKPNFLQVSAYRAASPPEAPIWNHLEVLLSPFKIDITKEIYQMIYDYAFPSEREIKSKKMHLAFEKEFQKSKATVATTTTKTTSTTATKTSTDSLPKVDEGSSRKTAEVVGGEDDDDDEDTAPISGPKVVQVKYLRFNESKVKVSYHGSAGSFKDVRLLLDSYTCESFEGRWRELVGQLKGNLAWSALKSVTGFAGRKLTKIKSAANDGAAVVVPVAAVAQTAGENLSDSNNATAPFASSSKQTSSVMSPAKKKSIFKKLFKTPTKNEKNERDAFMSGFSAKNPADK